MIYAVLYNCFLQCVRDTISYDSMLQQTCNVICKEKRVRISDNNRVEFAKRYRILEKSPLHITPE